MGGRSALPRRSHVIARRRSSAGPVLVHAHHLGGAAARQAVSQTASALAHIQRGAGLVLHAGRPSAPLTRPPRENRKPPRRRSARVAGSAPAGSRQPLLHGIPGQGKGARHCTPVGQSTRGWRQDDHGLVGTALPTPPRRWFPHQPRRASMPPLFFDSWRCLLPEAGSAQFDMRNICRQAHGSYGFSVAVGIGLAWGPDLFTPM